MGKPMNLETSVVFFNTARCWESLWGAFFFYVWPPNCRYYDTLLPRLPLSLGHSAWRWVFSNQLSPCWAVPPMGLEAWNAKWLWNLFSFLSCDRHLCGGGAGVDCDLHAGGGVGCNHTMDVWWDILVVLQTLRAPSFWNPPPILRKKSGPFQTWPPDGSPGFGGGRPSSCPSRSVKPGAFFFLGKKMTSGVESHKSWFSGNLPFFFLGNDHIGDTPRLPLYYDYGRKGVNYETNLIVLLVCRTVFFVWG